jgi:hypothetical protein
MLMTSRRAARLQRRLGAERLDRGVHALSAAEVDDRLDRIPLGVIDHDIGPELPRQRLPPRDALDRDDKSRAEQPGPHGRYQPHRAPWAKPATVPPIGIWACSAATTAGSAGRRSGRATPRRPPRRRGASWDAEPRHPPTASRRGRRRPRRTRPAPWARLTESRSRRRPAPSCRPPRRRSRGGRWRPAPAFAAP